MWRDVLYYFCLFLAREKKGFDDEKKGVNMYITTVCRGSQRYNTTTLSGFRCIQIDGLGASSRNFQIQKRGFNVALMGLLVVVFLAPLLLFSLCYYIYSISIILLIWGVQYSLQFAGCRLQLAAVVGPQAGCLFLCLKSTEIVRPCRNRLELWEERRHASCSLIHSTRCRVRRPHTSSLHPALFCALLGMF